MINKNRLKYQLFLLLLLGWIILSGLRTINNLTKIITEERPWIHLTDDEKNKKYFGAVYDLISAMKNSTDVNADVGFYTGGREFYYGRYALYPKKIIWYKTLLNVKRDVENKSIHYLLVCCGQQYSLSSRDIRSLGLRVLVKNSEGVLLVK